MRAPIEVVSYGVMQVHCLDSSPFGFWAFSRQPAWALVLLGLVSSDCGLSHPHQAGFKFIGFSIKLSWVG